MQKVFIADGSPSFPHEVSLQLKEHFEVRISRTGNDLVRVLCDYQPDILLLDLMIPGMDGITLLRCIQAKGVYPKVIAISRSMGYYLQTMLEQLGVAYCMIQPCDPVAAASRIMELSNCPKELVIPMPDQKQILQNMLLTLGFQQKHAGFGYLVDIIPQIAMDPGISYTKVLYPDAGKKVGKTGAHVERSIRFAVEYAWGNRNAQIWELFFPPVLLEGAQAPSNSDFIFAVASLLQRKEDHFGKDL